MVMLLASILLCQGALFLIWPTAAFAFTSRASTSTLSEKAAVVAAWLAALVLWCVLLFAVWPSQDSELIREWVLHVFR